MVADLQLLHAHACDSVRSLGMRIKIVLHESEQGGCWAEVPAIPGCATQDDSMDGLLQNLGVQFEGCLSIEVAPHEPGGVCPVGSSRGS